MTPARIAAVVLIAAGVLALAYRSFSYVEETHDVDLGPIEFEVKERERVEIPVWLGVALVAVGAGLLLTRRRA
jgi:hypothetical protein